MNAATISSPFSHCQGLCVQRAEVLSLLLFIINERAATLKEIYPPTILLSFLFNYLPNALCAYNLLITYIY